MGMRVGDVRVSSLGQKFIVQLDTLSDCDRIYHEKVSVGSTKLTIELQKALDFVRDDDVFVVTKLDRLSLSPMWGGPVRTEGWIRTAAVVVEPNTTTAYRNAAEAAKPAVQILNPGGAGNYRGMASDAVAVKFVVVCIE